jgi:predicted NAD-dependent protein-ADP-ribosyltransferase YbiA (DUF1768 family)
MSRSLPPEIFAIYFSAFSAHALEIDGVVYPTLEHAYHCLRYTDAKIIEEIRAAFTRKGVGNLTKIQEAWKAGFR